MPVFHYKAKNRNAETVQGSITARDQEEAIDLINQLGLLPVDVQINKADNSFIARHKIHAGINPRDLYFFTKNLASLSKSGISLLRTLAIIKEQLKNAYFKSIIDSIELDIKNGRSLSQALNNFPSVFSPLYVTMVYAGEESGNLHHMLISVAEHLKKQAEISSKVRLALAYPMFMGFVGVGTILFILMGVLPKMSGLFQNLGSKLPLPTLIMLQTSKFLELNGLWAAIVVMVFFLLIYRWMNSSSGRRVTGKVITRIPLFGEIILKTEIARFCRTMDLLMHSGISVVRALQVVIPLMSNDVVRDEFQRCEQELIGGGSFGDALKKTKEMPGIMANMIAVGEESGNLGEVLRDIADTYESETDENIKIMTTLLEPVMILLVGSIIGIMVFAILLPIFQTSMLNF